MKYQLESWVIGWATLLEGIAVVISFGFWWPNLSFKATFWAAYRKMERKKAER